MLRSQAAAEVEVEAGSNSSVKVLVALGAAAPVERASGDTEKEPRKNRAG